MSRKIEMNVASTGWTQMELVLLFYGWEACDPSHYWGPGVRDSYIVHYIHEGQGTVYLGGGISSERGARISHLTRHRHPL